MNWKKIVPIFIGLLIFVILISNANLDRVYNTLKNIEITWFLIAIIANIVLIFLKSLKWKTLVDFKVKLGFFETVKYFLTGFFFSTITPGRVGDLVRAKYLRKRTGLAYATMSVVLDRIIDIILLLLIGFVAVIMAAEFFGMTILAPEIILLAIIALIIGIYIVSMKSITFKLFNKINNLLIPNSFREKANKSFNNIYDVIDIFKTHPKTSIVAGLLGVAIWGIAIIMVYAIAESIQLGVPFYGFFIIVPLMALSDIIPLSIGGLGPREFITINTLAFFSVTYDAAITFSLLYFFTGYILVAFVGGITYFTNKIKIKI